LRLTKTKTCKKGETLLALNVAGEPGQQGPVGEAGPQGVQGDVGPQGPAGEMGPQGVQGDVGPQGPAGEMGPQGLMGLQGPAGLNGLDGLAGSSGASAYEIWLNSGHNGTTSDFLDSLIGPQGGHGPAGQAGARGSDGPQGNPGTPGKSAYELWLEQGNSGSVSDFLDSLKASVPENNGLAHAIDANGVDLGLASPTNGQCSSSATLLVFDDETFTCYNSWNGSAEPASWLKFFTDSNCAETGYLPLASSDPTTPSADRIGRIPKYATGYNSSLYNEDWPRYFSSQGKERNVTPKYVEFHEWYGDAQERVGCAPIPEGEQVTGTYYVYTRTSQPKSAALPVGIR